MIPGATPHDAKDAAHKTLVQMYAGWPDPRYTLAYARKAVISNFIKDKTRGPGRVAQRLWERGHVPHREGADDPALTRLENDEWVKDVLSCLSRPNARSWNVSSQVSRSPRSPGLSARP